MQIKTCTILLITSLLVSACSGNGGRLAAGSNTSACGNIDERPWCDTSLSSGERADLLIAAMSLSQKLDFLAGDDPQSAATGDPYTGVVNGIPELGIPDLRMSDGPVGPRGSPATAMPIPLSLAATFNPTMAYRTGAAIGNEVRNKGNDLVHAPVADLIRNPLAGRTFETFGEDPYLAGRMTVEWIKGSQDQGIMANVKHFLMNTQEGLVAVPPIASAIGGRHTVNTVVDERTLREIYLPPYKAAIDEADVASFMCAYNYVNGEPACSSQDLLQSLLKEDWGYNGFHISDYYLAIKDTVQTANTSAVIEMPYGFFYQPGLLQAAVQSGAVPESRIDEHLKDIFGTLFRFNFFDRERYQTDDSLVDRAHHAAVARETVEQGTVLLKNNGLLPLNDQPQHIAVIGKSAIERPSGGGSSFVTPYEFKTPLDALIERAGEQIQIDYLDGTDTAAATALAAQADLALVFASNIASEGVDRFCLSLDCSLSDVPDSLLLNTVGNGSESLLDLLADPVLGTSPIKDILDQAFAPILLGAPLLPVSHDQQDALIAQIAAAQSNTIVVLQNSGPVLTPWRENIAALLQAWYPGQAAGEALARILFGDVDPGGRLPVSFPNLETDTPVAGNPQRYPGIANQAEHSEGIFIGYRWFDQQNVEPAYPFGFGLSYGHIEYSDFAIERQDDMGVFLSANARNSSNRPAWAAPQIYVNLPSGEQGLEQAPAALKAFAKRLIAPGASEQFRFEISWPDLQSWHSEGWTQTEGCYHFKLGKSSRHIIAEVGLDWPQGKACS